MSTLRLAAESLRQELPPEDPLVLAMRRLVAANDWPTLRQVIITHEITRREVLKTQLAAVETRLRAIEALPEEGGAP